MCESGVEGHVQPVDTDLSDIRIELIFNATILTIVQGLKQKAVM